MSWNKLKRFDSSNDNVCKYIFTKNDAVAEAVLYKYNDYYDRTVICCSVMSGCPVGCVFCGTGKKFIRNLTTVEIISQIEGILKDKNIKDINSKGKRFQIMFMSMGEPMLNWGEVEFAIKHLHLLYPNAELLISTVGINDSIVFSRIIKLSKEIDKLGLQFSIHKSNDEERNILIPYKNKLNINMIRDAGLFWWKETGRKVYLNYCIDGANANYTDFKNLNIFSPMAFNFTFSVICSKDETTKEAGYNNLDTIRKFENYFVEEGYNTRIFNPEGQDDIGGGCGQLWYVQQWMKEIKIK